MFTGALTLGLVGLLAAALLYVTQALVSLNRAPLVVLPFQSGWPPAEHALSRYHARWYPATILFLAFDVEMLFMYPWAVVVADIGMSALVEMFVFLGALLVAVLWAWREGALRWV